MKQTLNFLIFLFSDYPDLTIRISEFVSIYIDLSSEEFSEGNCFYFFRPGTGLIEVFYSRSIELKKVAFDSNCLEEIIESDTYKETNKY